jgi:hypothetical protein
MNEQRKPWSEFKYEPVGPVVHKLLARYLRTQRKNMLRFFQERGLYSLANRMRQIRNSKQGMMAKNQMFQEVLNEYSKLATPANPSGPVAAETVPGSVLQPSPAAADVPEAADQQATGDRNLGLQVPQ